MVELIAGDPLRKLVVETVPTAEEPGASARKLREVIKESEPCAPVGRGPRSEEKERTYSAPLVGPEGAPTTIPTAAAAAITKRRRARSALSG